MAKTKAKYDEFDIRLVSETPVKMVNMTFECDCRDMAKLAKLGRKALPDEAIVSVMIEQAFIAFASKSKKHK